MKWGLWQRKNKKPSKVDKNKLELAILKGKVNLLETRIDRVETRLAKEYDVTADSSNN